MWIEIFVGLTSNGKLRRNSVILIWDLSVRNETSYNLLVLIIVTASPPILIPELINHTDQLLYYESTFDFFMRIKGFWASYQPQKSYFNISCAKGIRFDITAKGNFVTSNLFSLEIIQMMFHINELSDFDYQCIRLQMHIHVYKR